MSPNMPIIIGILIGIAAGIGARMAQLAHQVRGGKA